MESDDFIRPLSAGDSFKASTMTKMRYSDFLSKMNVKSVTVAIKDNKDYIMKSLIDEIAPPSFISDFSDIERVELMQGLSFVNPAHYEKNEQFLCAIDGYA